MQASATSARWRQVRPSRMPHGSAIPSNGKERRQTAVGMRERTCESERSSRPQTKAQTTNHMLQWVSACDDFVVRAVSEFIFVHSCSRAVMQLLAAPLSQLKEVSLRVVLLHAPTLQTRRPKTCSACKTRGALWCLHAVGR